MMERKIFTNLDPAAVEGLRRAYAGTGAEIHPTIEGNGRATVIVILPKIAEPAG